MRSRGPEMPDMADTMPSTPDCRARRAPRLGWPCRDRRADALSRSAHRRSRGRARSSRREGDERALITLANNAAVAVENTRTLEQEREAVRRLSEMNQLKSDFLDTAQHELRTPVLAIQGQIELLNVAWDKWDDATKLEIVRDVDISVKLLGETVENVVDFALVNSDTIDVPCRRWTSQLRFATRPTMCAATSRTVCRSTSPWTCADHPLSMPTRSACVRCCARSIDNAVKFTPEGGHVRVTARRVKGAGAARSRSSMTASASVPRRSRFFSTASTRRTTAARAATGAWAWGSRSSAASATRTPQR